ncbi:uncharacterized protein LOC122076428 [Macadamia integrifolia]|uniref:uncharacterized protein LOC122076428 n=1 Tax=Macadamia integrifolia TaxID=60698 RepID=UPI001C4F29B3|nr:uncharacterized protein LOC122076428 [Macadamia integrifolia]
MALRPPHPPVASGSVQRALAPVQTFSSRCYNCHSYGHFTNDCRYPVAAPPIRPPVHRPTLTQGNQPQGRMYALTAEEAEASTEVVAGLPAYVLFDSGASQSFVFKRSARKLDVPSKTLECKLVVSTPTGMVEHLKEMCGPCPVEINRKKLDAQIIKFNTQNFDVILGMDWLATHRANMMCVEKQVTVLDDKGEEIMYQAKRSK